MLLWSFVAVYVFFVVVVAVVGGWCCDVGFVVVV